MNDMNEREQDAAVIAEMRAWCSESDAIEAAAWSFALDQRLEELRELLSDGSGTFADSALRTIDRLTAERDAARAENMRLRAAFEKMRDQYEALARDWTLNAGLRSFADTEVQRIRAILDGTP